MSAELEQMVVRLVGDGSSYQSMLEQAQQQTQEATQEISSAFDNLADGIGQVGASIQSVGSTVTGFGAKISAAVTAPLVALGAAGIYTFGIQELAEEKLRAALIANGRQVESLHADYLSFASGLQKVTTVGDETTIQLIQMAESLGLTGESAKRSIKNAIGLASAMGLNIKTAIRLTTGLEQGKTTMLGRYFPALSQIEDETQRAAKAQELLAKMFGTATAEAKTSSGRITQMTNAIGDLTEQIGGVLAGELMPVVDFVKDLTEKLQQLSPHVRRAIVFLGVGLAAIGPIIVGVGVALTMLGSSIWNMSLIMGFVSSAFALMGKMLLFVVSPVGLVTIGVIALTVAISNMTGFTDKALTFLSEKFQQFKNFALGSIRGIIDAFMAGDMELAARIFWLSLKVSWQTGIAALEELWLKFKGATLQLWEEASSGLAMMWVDMAAGMSQVWNNTITAMASGWENLTRVAGVLWSRMTAGLEVGVIKIKALLDDTVDEQGEILKVMQAQRSEENNIIKNSLARRDAIKDEAEARKQAIETERSQKQQILAENLNTALNNHKKEANNAVSSTRAQLDKTRAQLEKSIADAAQKRKETEEELAREKPQFPNFNEMADQIDNVGKKMQEVFGDNEAVRAGTKEFRDSIRQTQAALQSQPQQQQQAPQTGGFFGPTLAQHTQPIPLPEGVEVQTPEDPEQEKATPLLERIAAAVERIVEDGGIQLSSGGLGS